MKMRLLAVLLFCLSVFLVSPKFVFAVDPEYTINDTTPALPANPAPPISINGNPALPFVPTIGPVPNTNTGAPEPDPYYDTGTGSGSSSSTTKLVPCNGTDCTIQMILTMGVKIYNYLTGFGAILAVAAIVYGGFSYIKSQGDPSAMKEAKTIVVNAIIGIVILAASALIVNTILQWIGSKNITKVEQVS